MAAKQKYKIDAFEGIDQAVSALHDIGAIDNARMRYFDGSCLVAVGEGKLTDSKQLQEAVRVGD